MAFNNSRVTEILDDLFGKHAVEQSPSQKPENTNLFWVVKKQNVKMSQDNHVLDYLIREKAIDYLHELEDSFFEVVLVPPREEMNEGHRNRALQSGNPQWYSSFAAENVNCRGIGRKRMKRPRTFIRKDWTIRCLRLFIEKGRRGGVQIERLLEFIGRQVENERFKEDSEYVEGIPF